MLGNISLGHSPLTDRIFLYRHGKDPSIVLEKLEITSDVFSVLISHMMHNAPNGAQQDVSIDGKSYTVRVMPSARGGV